METNTLKTLLEGPYVNVDDAGLFAFIRGSNLFRFISP